MGYETLPPLLSSPKTPLLYPTPLRQVTLGLVKIIIMSLEEGSFSISRHPVDVDSINGVEPQPPSLFGVADEGCRAPRLPRWTRQEILVLIQGKREAENRVRRGRAVLGMGGAIEPKWASVSSYCKRHGVNRGPVQCRKRWSNLAGDFKKIKDWESHIRDDTESFWLMRNDLRRERKLPGFFDREVYDILDGGGGGSVSVLSLALTPTEEPLFDSASAAQDGLFSDFEQEDKAVGSPEKEPSAPPPPPPLKDPAGVGVAHPLPISEKHHPAPQACEPQGTTNEKQSTPHTEMGSASHEGRKRKRFTVDGEEETISLQNQLIDVLERNGKMLTAQLEAQNTNFQLDREQRKDHANSLVSVLNKLADALGKIADKL